MQRMILGRTGLEVNRLGLGGIPIQRLSETAAVEMVLHAIDAGVDFIDTARGYTTSEQRIGLALQKTDHQVTIASKSQRRSADGIRADIDISLENLQRNAIDLYQCHFAKDEQDYQRIISPGGALEGLEQARSEGLVHHLGISSHSLDLCDRILDDDLFDTIMVCFSFLEPAAKQRIIPKALDRQVGVIAMKPFSGGVLDQPELALKYVLGHPGILVIPGVEDPGLFDANWAVFTENQPLSRTEKEAIARLRRQYDKNFCRRCDYCQPCSEDIPIQTALGVRFVLKRFGDEFLETPWVKTAIAKARNCSRCGDCLERCPYGLPIPDLIAENLEWLDDRRSDQP